MKKIIIVICICIALAGCSLFRTPVPPLKPHAPIVVLDSLDVQPVHPDTAAVIDIVAVEPLSALPSRRIVMSSFLGGGSRCYYGNGAISEYTVSRKLWIGGGETTVRKKTKKWYGAGWTGQPLVVQDAGELYILQSCFDHTLRCIAADSLKTVWSYEMDDILKGCGTVYRYISGDSLDMLVVLQGSRYGVGKSLYSKRIWSLRAINFDSASELWRMNIPQTHSYSRDNDSSPLVLDDAIFNAAENGIGYFLSRDPYATVADGEFATPQIDTSLTLYETGDIKLHGGNLVAEASPSICGDLIMVTSGAGHVYGIHKESRQIVYDLKVGSDMDGTPVVNHDNRVFQTVEKQYIKGRGGLLKLNPAKAAAQSIEWFLPTQDTLFAGWEGGIIGSCAINDEYIDQTHPPLFAVIAIDGNLYVGYQNRYSGNVEVGYDGKTQLPTPLLVATIPLAPSIGTPIFTNAHQLVVPSYNGLYFFDITYGDNVTMRQTAHLLKGVSIEATPTVVGDRLYIAARNGYFYEIK